MRYSPEIERQEAVVVFAKPMKSEGMPVLFDPYFVGVWAHAGPHELVEVTSQIFPVRSWK